MRSNFDDAARMEQYNSEMRQLKAKLQTQENELNRTQDFAKKSQAVTDCLNTLLVLESEQTGLYEKVCPITDHALASQFQEKKARAQDVLGRLNSIMGEEARQSLAFSGRN